MDNQGDGPLESAFSPIYGSPCWNVKPGHGSFLTLEFGQPRIEFHEPRAVNYSRSLRLKQHHARRRVIIHGEWYLWIYCCYWNFFSTGRLSETATTRRGFRKQ